MTVHQMALLKTLKTLAIMFLAGFVAAVLLHFVPLNYILIGFSIGMLGFLLKLMYDTNLSWARDELEKRHIDNRR